MIDWSELRDFLAVAETGSLSAAARRLRVSQPTVGRKIAALEDRLGAALFIRTPRGFDLTETGDMVMEHAARMREEADTIERRISGRDSDLSGKVAISVTEAFGSLWLPRVFAAFHEQYPKILIDIKTQIAAADLVRREADIAIRMFRPVQSNLIAKKAGALAFGYYASRDYVKRFGAPKSKEDIANHKMVIPDGEMLRQISPGIRGASIPLGRPSFLSNSMITLVTATRAGFGIGIHSALADLLPDLVRVLPDYTPFEIDFWLVTHPDLKRSARVRAAFDFLSGVLEENRDLLAGKRSNAAR